VKVVDIWHHKAVPKVSEVDFSKAEHLAQVGEIRYAYICAEAGKDVRF